MVEDERKYIGTLRRRKAQLGRPEGLFLWCPETNQRSGWEENFHAEDEL
jgi:hypothetical protein